jgi:hypothetical protein
MNTQPVKHIQVSHNCPPKIKEGWQQGMYVQEVTSYEGNGPLAKVIGTTPEEAKANAERIVRAWNNFDQLETLAKDLFQVICLAKTTNENDPNKTMLLNNIERVMNLVSQSGLLREE